MERPVKKFAAVVGCSVVLLTACGSNSKSTSAATKSTSVGSAAFCTNVKALGSVSKATQDAMAMNPSESMKDFEALATKVAGLKASAPANLVAAIDTVAARYTLESKAETMKAADPSGGKEETQMLADHKAADDAAFAKLIAGARSTCKVDVS